MALQGSAARTWHKYRLHMHTCRQPRYALPPRTATGTLRDTVGPTSIQSCGRCAGTAARIRSSSQLHARAHAASTCCWPAPQPADSSQPPSGSSPRSCSSGCCSVGPGFPGTSCRSCWGSCCPSPQQKAVLGHGWQQAVNVLDCILQIELVAKGAKCYSCWQSKTVVLDY